MNPTNAPQTSGHRQPAPGLSLDDVLFTLFRHKWLILGFICLGLVGAAAARLLRPPLYVSKAKLMVHYVIAPAVNRATPETQEVKPVDASGQAIIANQVELFTSRDVVTQAVDLVGPERILARLGGGNQREWAVGVVGSGVEVEPPRTAIITVAFRHPDPQVAPEVLGALIQAYLQKNVAVTYGSRELDNYYRQQVEQMRNKLAQTEEELKHLKRGANVLFLDETKRSYQDQIAKARSELLDATRELAEQRALLGGSPDALAASTNASQPAVPSEKLNEYADIASELDGLKKKERSLLLEYTEAHPVVQTVRGQIEKLSREKAGLERAFPVLAQMNLGSRGSTNALGDAGSQLAEARRLEARVNAFQTILSNIQLQASQVMESEPKIAEAQRRRDEEEKNYEYLLKRLDQTQSMESVTPGEANGISMVQSPTPPALDSKKLLKLVGMVFVGCVGLGFGLAFLIDFGLDRSIKRSQDVERHLHLPVFLTIPDTEWSGRTALPFWKRARPRPLAQSSDARPPNPETAVAPWSPGHQLHAYAEGLRERLITHFEVHNLNLKKPKLVAVTACSEGSGVSSLASSLAASLSKTGDGNVLLVDMNADRGVAHSFYQGKPGCGLSDVLEPDSRSEAQVQENLFVASMTEGNDKLAKVVPNRINHLMPRLKASDYDYIIFDMPPVTQTSATPRLAGYMDIVLLVLEAEKTRQHAATRASALMRDARANVAAVLNKYRQHVPTSLSQEL